MRGFCAAIIGLVLVAAPSLAQEPIALSRPTSIRILTGDDPSNRYEPGDIIRVSVYADRSVEPTEIVATQGTTVLPLPYYAGPITTEELYQATIPFDRLLTPAWTITARRAGQTVRIATPPQPPVFDLPLLDDMYTTVEDEVGTLHWTWPDFSDAQLLGLRMAADIALMQLDMQVTTLLNFGLRDHPIEIGEPGEPFAITIPSGLEEGMLYVVRVHIDFYDEAGNVIAKTINFVPDFYAAPDDRRVQLNPG